MIVLDGRQMADRQGMHAELKKKLSLPEYYGNNLDALNDCLGERTGRELVVIEYAGELLEGCEDYALGMLRVFADNHMQVLLS
jgi:ribonuclease inhibitor